MDQRLKNKSVHDWLGKRVIGQNWADHEEEGAERIYTWQEGQWCLGDLTRSQKRRVQCLRNREMEQAQAPEFWHIRPHIVVGSEDSTIHSEDP